MAKAISVDERFAGEGMSLRLAVEADCTQRYLDWLLDPQVNRYLETRWSEQSLGTIRAFVAGQLAAADSYLFAIEAGGVHVGNLKIGPVNARHGCADVSYFIGDRACWGRGIATAAIRVACAIGFGRLGLHRIQAGVYAGNIGSIRALQKAGFQPEGSWRGQLLGPGGREDHLWFGLLAEEHQP